MMNFDTPAGRFRILLNGDPVDFDLYYTEPVQFRTLNNADVISANSYVARMDITGLTVTDIVSGVLDRAVLTYSGCIAGMESMMWHESECTFELSTLYTEDYEKNETQRFLPYQSFSNNPHGFAFRIIQTPSKFCASPIQREVLFLIAWAFVKDAWSSQTTEALSQALSITLPYKT